MGTSLSPNPLVFYDGQCKFCDATIQFVIRFDKEKVFRFVALQSPRAQELFKGQTGPELTSIVVHTGEGLLFRSDAIFYILSRLSGGWRLLAAFRVIPKPIRDSVYNWVARNRYRWFGRWDQCKIPDAQVRDRFLE